MENKLPKKILKQTTLSFVRKPKSGLFVVRVYAVYGDGRCLFRCFAVSLMQKLQLAAADGSPVCSGWFDMQRRITLS